MDIISRKVLREFWEQFTDSEVALSSWYRIMEKTDFSSFEELRQTFPSAETDGELVRFNIGVKKYRLVASIHFNRGKVYILEMQIHTQYYERPWRNWLV